MFGTFQNAKTNLNGTLFLYPVRVYPIGTRIGDDFMKIGYIRVSTDEQNTIRQEILMKELGVDEIYIDKISGKNTNRPQLKAMLDYVRHGDTVIVSEISRFARNTKDLLELVEALTDKVVSKWRSGKITATQAMRELGMSRSTSVSYTHLTLPTKA